MPSTNGTDGLYGRPGHERRSITNSAGTGRDGAGLDLASIPADGKPEYAADLGQWGALRAKRACEHASVFYHDFLPGTYHFTVESYGWDYSQDTTLQLRAGMQPFLEIQTEREFISGDQTRRDIFYVRPLPLYWASKYFPTITYLGAREP